MPTGYTAPIADGISFEKFIWGCARAFGALVMMRDDPQDAPIPERFEPSDYHAQALKELRATLNAFDAMSHDGAEQAAIADYNKVCAYRAERVAEKEALRNKYQAMLEQVRGWTPPTPDHQGLKDFMEKQIIESIDFDCRVYPEDAPRQKVGTDWLSEQVAETRRLIAYHEKEHAKEIERTESRNRWIAALRASVNGN